MLTDYRPLRDAVDELWELVRKTEADVARKYAETPEQEHARLKAKGETRTDHMSVQWEVNHGQMTANLSIEGVDGVLNVYTGWVEQAYPILWYRGCEKLVAHYAGGVA